MDLDVPISDLPINEPEINTGVSLPNFYEWVLPYDFLMNLSICFLPGVKSRIIQDGEFIHIKISTYYRVDFQNLTNFNLNPPIVYKFISEEILDKKIQVYMPILHRSNETQFKTKYFMPGNDIIILGIAINFWGGSHEAHNTPLSVSIKYKSGVIKTFTKLSKKIYQGDVYYSIDAQKTIIPVNTKYKFLLNLSNHHTENFNPLDVYIYYINSFEKRNFLALLC